jgi:photosystem II stability/assembly factor-like uncharacterized protein
VGRRTAVLVAVALALAVPSALAAAGVYAWHDTPTGSDARLRGAAAVGPRTAWASGSLGTVLRTTDRGATWDEVGPPGTDALQFRDIAAFDADHAVILGIGDTPDAFRVYVTADGGLHWTLGFQNTDPNAFYDCMTFVDRKRGFAVSDPPDGKKFRIIRTDDGGYSWRVLDSSRMPDALPGEFAFAASGQCLTSARGGRTIWLATGGAAQARVFRSTNLGESWTVSATPVRSGPSGGIFALAFRDERHGIAVGGDFLTPDDSPDNFALTNDGGRTWTLVPDAPAEYRSGAAWVNGHTVVAVGPTGSDVSTDAGHTWTRFDDGSLDTVDCASPRACWAAGAAGRVAYLVRTP